LHPGVLGFGGDMVAWSMKKDVHMGGKSPAELEKIQNVEEVTIHDET
jgi:hypothetical protein